MRHITCSQIEPWLEPYVDGELAPWMAAIVQAHLDKCSQCSDAVRQLRAVNEAVREWALSELPQAESQEAGGLETGDQEASRLVRMLKAQAGIAGAEGARPYPLSWLASGARRIGITPDAAARALGTTASWSGHVLLWGARFATGALVPAAVPAAVHTAVRAAVHTAVPAAVPATRRSVERREGPPWAVKVATAAGRRVTRAAVAGVKWVGREALTLG